jgi:GNAT superfamily N-acetyltransferase
VSSSHTFRCDSSPFQHALQSEDTNATHFLLHQKDDKGAVHYIGTARAIRLPILPVTYDVGRICLTKKARAVGAGSILLTFLEQWVWDNGGDKMTGEAHEGFDGFYRK